MRTRWCVLALCIALVGLTGCGGGSAPVPSEPTPTQAATAPVATVTPSGAALLDWAATTYPQYFSGAFSDGTAAIAGYGTFSYRYWPDTRNYIGLLNGSVYVYGPVTSSQIMPLGPLSSYGCQVYDCTTPPAPAFSASSTSATVGQSVVLSWAATNASSCEASGGWSGSLAASGSQAVALTAATNTYSIACTGPGGQGTASLTVIGDTAPATAYSRVQGDLPRSAPVLARQTLTGRLSKVRSFEYAIATSTSSGSQLYEQIANSAADMILMTNTSDSPPLDRAAADPSGTKLIFGYLDVAEASTYWEPSLFAGGGVPTWFGNENPGYPGLYTVQYWNPAWEQALQPVVDKIVADGFDGIFLDVLSGDSEWQAGNIEGNPVNPDATAALATLVADIRAYLASKYPGKTIYLIGNNPASLALHAPATLKNLDGIFNELAYYGQSPANGATSQYIGTAGAQYVANTVAPAYAAAGVPVFGNDYPLPLNSSTADLMSFQLYSALGWVPSVTTAVQTDGIFSTGPFMFMATAANPVVTGKMGFTNYLSGGMAPVATLNGGDRGDFFIGGPGQNTIVGGAGNDTIYAHPEFANQKGKLVFALASGVIGSATTPSVSLSINGQTAVPATPLTAPIGSATQVFTVDVSGLGAISSVVLTVTNSSYADSKDFSNVNLQKIIYNGVEVDPGAGTYTNGSPNNGFAYSNNGTVSFPASAFDVASPFAANTSDVIDGGGGSNTVIYRGPASAYTVTKQPDGSWRVVSSITAEGPDTLLHVQALTFSDRSVTLP
jgi:endo-alpha-1,4-polygalactosaminidase (GH114 family)